MGCAIIQDVPTSFLSFESYQALAARRLDMAPLTWQCR